MNNINYEALNVFIEGMKGDWAQHVESSKSFQNGVNGRLHSHNGSISFSSVKGTKLIYSNDFIVKYNGFCAFSDELILIAKADKNKIVESGTGENNDDFNIITKEQIRVSFIDLNIEKNQLSKEINFDSAIKNVTVQELVATEDESPLIINVPFSEIENSNEQVDLGNYYEEIFNSNGFQLCQITDTVIPPNNKDYIDCIISITLNSDKTINDKLIWSGNLNIPMDAKIVTYGLKENNFYKRVYFTDYSNPFRVINIKDPVFSSRKASEFSAFQNVALLRPQIASTGTRGQIKAGTVMYCYRLFTANGQTTEFSPLSEDFKILASNTDSNFEGGSISETTTTNVKVKCNLINYKNFNEIECVVIEYEALGAPTSIRSLGIKKVAPVVYFDHYGNEAEFSSDLTLSEILVRKNSWKYCSDLVSKNNLLIASGLRNEPLPSYFQNVTHLFALHAWDENGGTFESYINPDPEKYRWIDPKVNSKMFSSERKVYNSIQSFEGFKITLNNKANLKSIETTIPSKSKETYDEYINEVYAWLQSIKDSPEFSVKFPNIKVESIRGKILFSKINPAIDVDFEKINFSYSTLQIIEDVQDDIKIKNLSIGQNKIHGYQSLGFNQGTGIRVTFNPESEELMTKAANTYPTAMPLINMKKPSQKKFFFKGEIYRLGLQVWLTDGSTPFTIPLGDIKIPELGENKMYLDGNSNPIKTNEKYTNSKVVGNKLMSDAISLEFEVRLSCEIQDKISMYQIVYVERTEDNRSILCQGISAPLERTNNFWHTEYVNLPDPVSNKWNLPFMGGPNYDHQGLITGDENINEGERSKNTKRVVTNRKLFYFDSPEIIFNIISADKIKNGKVVRVNRLNPDMPRDVTYSWNPEKMPAFSRKIPNDQIQGSSDELPLMALFSMFIEKPGIKNEISIEEAESFLPGEIKNPTSMKSSFEISNHGMTLGRPAWYYLDTTRQDKKCNNTSNSGTALHYELFKSANVAVGNNTVIIKTSEDVFSNEFIAQSPVRIPGSKFIHSNLDYYGSYPVYDTHALINIKMNNSQNIYGGRSELAYSKNVYIPLSDTIPILKTSSNVQKFKVYGDTYCTLFLRLKTFLNDGGVWKPRMDNHSSCRDKYEEEEYTRKGAWTYGVVLEASIEPKFSHDELFYKSNGKINLSSRETGKINEAYFQKNNLKTYIPKPYNFKDDPNLSNIIAVSDVKMNGDYIDSFSSFRVNNFYELEKDKGTAYNLAKFLDTIFVIQEDQVSQLMINENIMIASSAGEISTKQGSGNMIEGHKVIADFGTSIRRAIVETVSNDKNFGGFTFIDEKKFEWVKSGVPKLVEKDLQLKFREVFENDPIVDTEGYYDDEYKETNIRIRTKSGKSMMLSFNEKFDAFNGYMEIDSDVFFTFDNSIYAPNSDSKEIHQLNSGMFLEYFNEQKTLKLKYTINVNPQTVKIFKVWSATLNTKYPIKKITIETSLGQKRVILGTHSRYEIKEGSHNVPMKNDTDWDDLRGEWASVEVEVESKNNQKIDIFSFINFVRHSNQ